MKKVFFIAFLISMQMINSQSRNQSILFSGAQGSYASFGNINELNGVSRFSFEAWVYVNAWNVNSYIFSKNAPTLPAQNRIDIQLGQLSTKRLYFHVANNGNSYAQVDNSAIAVGQWNHIVMAYDGTQPAYKMIRIYINGTQVTSGITYSSGNGTLPASTASNTGAFELGKSFNGRIDEAKLYNYAISAQDIEMKNTINSYHPSYASLIAYWKMDQGESVITDTKNNYTGTLTGASLVPVSDNSVFKYKIVSTYVRSNFYESGQVSAEYLRNNNDIVYLTANPYADGELFFEYPVSSSVLTNAGYLSNFASRNGLMDFSGTGASMNCGKDLLNKVSSGAGTFSFASWVYIDQWNTNSCIFRKYESATKNISLELGNAVSNQLVFRLSNGADNYVTADNSGISTGGWHHVAVTYSGGAAAYQQVKMYVDGILVPLTYKNGDGILAATGPFSRSDFELGKDFDGKLDETVLSLLSLGSSEITALKNNPMVVDTWNETKTCGYWKYDNSVQPTVNSRAWTGVLDGIKQTFNGYSGAEIRFGVSGGEWKSMMASSAARTNFASKVKNIVETNGFDGVDLDFEWCETTQEWNNYSATILALNSVLSAETNFSVTLHPLYYKISPAAIEALDYISIQSYGPSPNRFPYNEFVTNVNSMLAYGYPSQKLIMGVPFYGAATDNSKVTASYRAAVAQNPGLDPAHDVITMNVPPVKSMTFNGQNTIIKKTQYVRDMDLAGIMYWDSATDTDYSNQLSLLRALNTVMNANVQLNFIPASLSARNANLETVAESIVKEKSILSVYPNPAKNLFTIELPEAKMGCIKIFNMQGGLIFAQNIDNQKNLEISTSFSPGIYLVTYFDETGKSKSAKLVIR